MYRANILPEGKGSIFRAIHRVGGGIIDLSHDVNALEATGSGKKLAACKLRYQTSREIYSRA